MCEPHNSDSFPVHFSQRSLLFFRRAWFSITNFPGTLSVLHPMPLRRQSRPSRSRSSVPPSCVNPFANIPRNGTAGSTTCHGLRLPPLNTRSPLFRTGKAPGTCSVPRALLGTSAVSPFHGPWAHRRPRAAKKQPLLCSGGGELVTDLCGDAAGS